MRCPNCGAQISLLAAKKYSCTDCGAKLQKEGNGFLFVIALLMFFPLKFFLMVALAYESLSLLIALILTIAIFMALDNAFSEYKMTESDKCKNDVSI
jgi:uncharacterized protein (DUF983 family)